jgi:hypothetical protein
MVKRSKPHIPKLEKEITALSLFISKHRKYVLLAYFLSFVVFVMLQFHILLNWDMLVRILNANYLFHNGFYFENQRALLESLLIGLFGFVFGGYAVYAYLVVAVLLFFIAIWQFSRSFGVDFLLLTFVLFNPFVIFYIAKNGSEVFLISFLMIFISFVKGKKYYAGIFLALALVSKYDALLFSPLLLFVLDRDVLKSLVRFVANIAVFFAALIPFFLYNLITYGNFIYTLALAFEYIAVVGRPVSLNLLGFFELVVPAIILMLIFFIKRKLEFNGSREDALILGSAAVLGIYPYYSANALFVGGLGAFRFFLLPLVFVLMGVAFFADKQHILPLLLFSALSLMLAFFMLANQPQAQAVPYDFALQVNSFRAVYNTTNCTVVSPDWVILDYFGLPAQPRPPTVYNGTPIVTLGPYWGSPYPLLSNASDVYIYGQSYCKFHKVVYNFLQNQPANVLQQLHEAGPCSWLFNESLKIGPLFYSCNAINWALNRTFA